MKMIAAITIMLCTSPAAAGAESWTSYRIPESGTSVEISASIFTEEAGRAGSVASGRKAGAVGISDPERVRAAAKYIAMGQYRK
ncbi:hypothetical protein QA649_14430 [Bradyrhizobium sp. CB1717]|uniref:hypothetical protein n=1 Tax=Bradyrhizobium sp. CB1717 TaxID=3039154 RepID=UPI0024B0B30C|nr:hypothetical protein [Bradyrhizobium sp. CB1717]WFU27356.1 hypothetical protein QA649_14430 [Bradyrhizobium sp. CB1717]